ncbi:MAG: cutinase [Mycobacterium sp.]|nr:cutinase [Mycobacterium sp.]
MNLRRMPRFVAAVTIGLGALVLGAAAPSASAQPCPDVEIVFARGTGEPPGVGAIGQAFVDAVRAQSGGRSVDVYAVNYAASNNFDDRLAFAGTVVDGIRDAGAHVEATAAHCPATRIVIGGYSQGAVVAGYVTSAEVPPGVPAEYGSSIPKPMPPGVADHVAAVALFGKPSDAFLRDYGAPPIVMGPLYAGKTTQLCAEGDTICDGTTGGGPSIAHALYSVNGMVDQAAAFAVGRL